MVNCCNAAALQIMRLTMIPLQTMKKIGEGQEAEIYLSPENKVLKLFKSSGFKAKSIEEESLLRILFDSRLPVPKTYGASEIESRPFYTMDYISGESLLSLLLKNPLNSKKYALLFAQYHARINSHTAPSSFKEEKGSLAWCIEHSKLDQKTINAGLLLLGNLPSSNKLCHGDYNLANVIINTEGKPFFIDWGGAAKGYFVSDVANAYLMIVNGALPPQAGFFLRAFLTFFRKNFAYTYVRYYKKINPFTSKEFNDWLLIRSMVRLAFCKDEEKPWLLNYIRKNT